MIKVIVVDDEYIVRKGLMATVNWQKYNMEVVADASNGQKGWEEFLEHSPEVVITDIVMPEQNGIELARKIKQAAPDTKILLLSCHRDFEYAQEGIRLGASGYILKTAFQDDEFEEYLKQFFDEIGKSKDKKQSSNVTEELIIGVNEKWPEPIQKAVQLITKDLSKSYSSVEVAYEVGLSRSHFSTLFSKSVGESFYIFTEKLKLNAASELLETTSLTLQEIGEKVGVHDGKYFSKWFKKCTGHTPSDYRQTKRSIHPDNLTPTP
ncbi:response regulator [Neobacillus drentensis]|uniref:response regulator transcription factor n=1 Tax=Neobacillus drentensis TaxID=220684 RepID=UPI002FFDD6BF